MNNPVFFLKSKRFWSMPASALVTWFLSSVPAVADLLAEAGITPEQLTTFVTAAVVWLVGMKFGQRDVTVKPKKET